MLLLLIGLVCLAAWQSQPQLRSYFIDDDKQISTRYQLEGSAYYRHCDAARAAGAAPIYRGSPGYRAPLDADGDGIACEPYRGRW